MIGDGREATTVKSRGLCTSVNQNGLGEDKLFKNLRRNKKGSYKVKTVLNLGKGGMKGYVV